MEISIKKAELVDLAAILELQKLAYAPEAKLNGDPNIPPMTQTLAELQAEARARTVLKAELSGKLVGSVRGNIQSGVGHIGRLMVQPELQGRGIGTRLMAEMEKTLSANKFEVFTGSKSLSNIALYQRLGYRTDRTEKVGKYTLVYLTKERKQT